MSWGSMAASGTGSVVFIYDVTPDRSSEIKSVIFCSHSNICYKTDDDADASQFSKLTCPHTSEILNTKRPIF